MPQQVADRDRAFRGRGLERGLAGLRVFLIDRNLHFGEFGQVFADRVVELKLAFLVEHHHRDARDRLGHRVDAVNRIEPHRLAGLDVCHAESFLISDLAAPRDQPSGARNLFLRHVPVHHSADVGEATTGQPDLFRRDGGRITIRRAGRRADYRIDGQREQNHQERNQQTSHNSSEGIAEADWP
jgi:hypothetical protein